MLVSPRCITVLSLTSLLLVGKIKWRRFTMRSALLLCTYYIVVLLAFDYKEP